jgi:hypothetical protein
VHSKGARNVALGRLANAELRQWRIAAHQAFDPLWQAKMARERISRNQARTAGYRWLAGRIGINLDQCHIGAFDIDECKKVVELCRPLIKRTSRDAN